MRFTVRLTVQERKNVETKNAIKGKKMLSNKYESCYYENK